MKKKEPPYITKYQYHSKIRSKASSTLLPTKWYGAVSKSFSRLSKRASTNFITGPLYAGGLKYWGTNGTSDLLNGQSCLALFARGNSN
jgi:hypothetical protein